MMEPVKVVVRCSNGKIIKGYTNDFFPHKNQFHVRPIESQPADKGIEVQLKELKAVFFVKDFIGNPKYSDKKEFSEGQQSPGRKMEVIFKDGEVFVGTTLSYDPKRIGFIVIPADSESNNLSAFVVAAAVKRFRFLQ